VKVWERAIVLLAPAVGGVWVRSRRRRYRRIGRPLLAQEREALEGFFSAEVLDRVRVAVVERIETPVLARALPVKRLGALVDLSAVRGMAFGDAVVTVGSPGMSLLFHELVHVVQYEEFGIGPMLRRYVGDFFRSGRDYFAIDAERCAYELEARFEAEPAARFDVAAEVWRIMGGSRGG
jgi:hypothetical protein